MSSQRMRTFVAFRYRNGCVNISGVYQCGPASVEAVKCGAVGFNYDVSFLLSTVNADLVRWKEDDTSEFNYSKIDSNKYQ
jgi:hypothetical protein